MQRVWLTAAALLLAACGGATGLCGGQKCAAGQRCDNTNGSCVVDEPPKLALVTPADPSQVTANPMPFSGTASDDEAPPKVEWSVDEVSWTAVDVNDGAFSGTAPLPALDGKPLTFTVRATDRGGQVTTVHAGLSVDDVPPACEQVSPMPLQVFKTGQVDIRFNVSGYKTLEVTLDGLSITPTVAGGEVDYSWPVPTEDWITHKVHLIATDAAGNVCEIQSGYVVDNVPPVILFEQPTAGQVMGLDTFGDEFAFGQSTDGSLVTNTVVDVDDGNGFVQSGIWAGHWVVGRALPSGEDFVQHVIKVKATDLAGNVTEADSTWVADVVPPRLTILGPGPGQAVGAQSVDSNGDVFVSWTVADGDPTLAVSSPQAPGQTFSPPTTGMAVPTASTDNGTPYMVELTATTRTGSTTATVGFTVDRVAPFIVSSSTPLGGRTATVPVTVHFSEATNKYPMPNSAWSADGVTLTVSPPGVVGDEVVMVLYSGITDASGNPLVMPLDPQVRTTPRYWDAGSADAGLIDVPGATALSASSDSESVLTFATLTGTHFTLNRVNPHYGQVDEAVSFDLPALTQIEIQTSSFLPANPSATAHRLMSGSNSANNANLSYVFSGRYFSDDQIGSTYGWEIIDPLVPGEPGVSEAGELVGGYPGNAPSYFIRDQLEWNLPFYKVGAVGLGHTHWSTVEANATGQWADFGCDAGSCGFIQAGQFSDATGLGTHSVASTTHCDLHTFASSAFDGGYVLTTGHGLRAAQRPVA
jgi:hypothetical protein